MDAVDQIVGIHHSRDLALFDHGFKGGEVDFAQSALIDIGTDVVAIVLLVVGGEVFERRAHALRLNTRNV